MNNEPNAIPERLADLARTGMINAWRVTDDGYRISVKPGHDYEADAGRISAWIAGFDHGYTTRHTIEDDDEFVPVPRAHEIIGCAQVTLYRMLSSGRLPKPPGYGYDDGRARRPNYTVRSGTSQGPGYTRSKWITLAKDAGIIDEHGNYVPARPFVKAAAAK